MTDRKSRKITGFLAISAIIAALAFGIFTEKDGRTEAELPLEPHAENHRVCRLELNGADRESLLAVPGMRRETAEAILRYRDLRGGFRTLGQLWEIPELTGEDFTEIGPYVTVSRRTP